MIPVSAWEAIFLLVVLKIPMIYLAVVVWWAIRAEPGAAAAGGEESIAFVPLTPCNWDESRRRAPRRRPPTRRPGGPRVRPSLRARAGAPA